MFEDVLDSQSLPVMVKPVNAPGYAEDERHTVHSTVTDRELNRLPVNRTGSSTFQPGGSPAGPTRGVPALYAACRSSEGGSARDRGV